MAKDIWTQERVRWEWDEGPSGKTQEERIAVSDKFPSLPHPSCTHTHTLHCDKLLSFWCMWVCVCEGVQMCMMMHVCLLKSQAYRARIQASMTYQYSKQLQQAFINRGGKINQIMKQCSAKWTRNGLLGILLVICCLTITYAPADSQVTMSVSLKTVLSNYAPQYWGVRLAHLPLIPPQTLVVIVARLFSRLLSAHDSICPGSFFPTDPIASTQIDMLKCKKGG